MSISYARDEIKRNRTKNCNSTTLLLAQSKTEING